MAQFPTVGGFLCGGPQLLSNLHGAVPGYQRIYTMATQQFVWRSSRLSGSLCMAGHGYWGIYMAQFPTVGGFYMAVHSYSAIYMAQFLAIRGFTLWLLSNLYGAVPDCREVYVWRGMATVGF